MTPTDREQRSAPARPRRSWTRGQGAVRKIGNAWYIRYVLGPKRREEKVFVKTKQEALACLRSRQNQIDKGELRSGSLSLRVCDLYKLIQDDYFIKGQHVGDLSKRWVHLEPVFGQRKVREVHTGGVVRYSADRLREGAVPATVQREISCLRRMFRLGLKQGLVTLVPTFPQVEQDGLNARQGFFEDADFQKVCAALPPHLQPLALMAYWTGARKGELLKLEWRHVNLTTGKVELEAGMVKNKEPRSFYLPSDALQAVQRWRRTTTAWELQHQCKVPFVVHLDGRPVKDFRASWDRAFTLAGVERKLFHDLRRTAVRNYVDSGMAKSICREISGHKTEDVFERYNIRDNDKDKQAAAQAIARTVQGRNGEAMGKESLCETV